MKLIPEWKDSWRLYSNQAVTAVGTGAAVVAGYPDLMILLTQTLGGSAGLQALIIAITILILALRLWKQGDDDEGSDSVTTGGGNGPNKEQAN